LLGWYRFHPRGLPARALKARIPVKRIGMGIVGAGFIGPHHIDAVRRLGYVDVLALADMNEGLARDKAASLSIPKAYGSYDALLADPGVDAVYISMPNSLHHEWTIKCLRAGKHVLCEKPFALTATQAKEMFDTAKKAGMGALLGAVLGKVVGGTEGAIIGLVVGAGGAIAATKGDDVELPEGSVLTLRLERPLTVRP